MPNLLLHNKVELTITLVGVIIALQVLLIIIEAIFKVNKMHKRTDLLHPVTNLAILIPPISHTMILDIIDITLQQSRKILLVRILKLAINLMIAIKILLTINIKGTLVRIKAIIGLILPIKPKIYTTNACLSFKGTIKIIADMPPQIVREMR